MHVLVTIMYLLDSSTSNQSFFIFSIGWIEKSKWRSPISSNNYTPVTFYKLENITILLTCYCTNQSSFSRKFPSWYFMQNFAKFLYSLALLWITDQSELTSLITKILELKTNLFTSSNLLYPLFRASHCSYFSFFLLLFSL